VETHPRPEEALSDGPSMLPLEQLDPFLAECAALHAIRQPVGS
jgi:3-deoxy-D-manno-octulosonic acid (KDO) 8-phosphate synthase